VTEDVANVEQDEYWNSPDQATHWVEHQDRYDAMLAPLERRLHDAAAISASDHVLDVGCGCGTTTRAAARTATAGDALGVDLSSAMLERARALAEQEGLTNVRFVRGDAQVQKFDEAAFDLAVSRFGVMFFGDPTAAFTNLARAVRRDGRTVFLCWQDRLDNEWIVVPTSAAAAYVPLPERSPDEPGPFALGHSDRVRTILAAAGWRDVNVDEVREPLRLGADADDTVAFLRGIGSVRTLFEDVDEATVRRAMDSVREALVSYETPSGVFLGSAAWLVSARR
jgi:SAM-dependent methyltransferase